jgi:protein dithiol oxidoreductase (disulfide-forming)
MKSFLALILAPILALTSSFAIAQAQFVAGVDYTILPQAQPTLVAKGNVEVLEFFSYGCPACARTEPSASAWKAKASKQVQLRRIPVVFHGPWEPMARAYMALEVMGNTETAHNELFGPVNSGKQDSTLAEIADIVAKKGIDKAKFMAIAQSFAISNKLKQNALLLPRYMVDGTPSFIVSGKYKINIASFDPVGLQRAFRVADFLVQKELIERAAVVPAAAAPRAAAVPARK